MRVRKIMFLGITALLLAGSFYPDAQADTCSLQSTQHSERPIKDVVVRTVIDGDTVRLDDGRLVRFIGINTPEIDHKYGHSEPYAEQARDTLDKLLARYQYQIRLQYGIETKGPHGRLLANVFTRDGKNIESQLIKAGLGVWIVVPPNLAYMDCFKNAEQYARNRHLGVWRTQFKRARDVSQLSDKDTGFQWIRGKITRIGRGKKFLWLGFDMLSKSEKSNVKSAMPHIYTDVALRVNKDDLHYFKDPTIESYLYKTVRVKGWLTQFKRQLVMNLRHPASIELEQ